MSSHLRPTIRPARGDARLLLAKVREAVGKPAPDPATWRCPCCGSTGAVETEDGWACRSEWCSLSRRLPEADTFLEVTR